MQLRSSLIYHSTTEVIGTKAANEGGLVQRDKHDDFELKPVNDDGLNQSIASDVVKSKPVNVDGVDRSGAPSNNFDLNYRESLQALAGESGLVGGVMVMGGLQALTAESGLVGGVISSRLEPIRIALFGVQVQFSIGGWNSWFVFGLFLLACTRAVCYLFEFMHPSRWSTRPKKRKKRGKRNWRRRETRFHCRRLHVNLVKRCRRRVGNRPPRRDGSRFRSPHDTKHARKKRREARQRSHWENVRRAKEYWEFCESPRPKPTHVDAPVWEPLLSWFCFESDFSDDFPAYGRMSTALDAEERDRWKKYLHEFIETEDHVANIKNLQARAEAARRSMNSTNRGSSNNEGSGIRNPQSTSQGTSLWSRVLSCWRHTRRHSVIGRLAFVTGSTYLGYFEGRSFNYLDASAQLALTNRVSIHRDQIRVFDTGASDSAEQRLRRRKQLIRESNDHGLQTKCIEVQSLRMAEAETAVDQTPLERGCLLQREQLRGPSL